MTDTPRPRERDAATADRPGTAENPAAALGSALDRAIERRQAQQYDEAEALCRDILERAPAYADAWNLLGAVLLDRRRPEPALSAFRRAAELQPGNALALFNIGLALARLRRFDEAIASFRRATAAAPDYAPAHFHLANALRETDRPAEAVEIYGRVVALQPDNAGAHTNLGMALESLGRLDEAIASYRRALAAQPALAEAHNNLGNVLQSQGKIGDAIECYRRAIELKPGLAFAHHNLGNAYRAERRLDEAAVCFRRAVALVPDYAQAHLGLGLVLKSQGQTEEAIQCQRRAIAATPEYADAHYQLGTLYHRLGRLDDAVAEFRRAAAIRPEHPETHNDLGLALEHQGKLPEAADSYRRAIALQPKLAESHNNLGNVLQADALTNTPAARANAEQAIECYRRALALKPDFAMAHSNLGNALRLQGRLDEAVACHRRALALDPDYVSAHSNMGIVLRDLGRVNEAIESFDRAIALQPDHIEANWNRGLALLLLGDLAGGFKGYEWRWRLKHKLYQIPQFSQPLWDGSDLAGRRILLHAEQGFGDTLQFIRYATVAAARGGHVIVECQPALKRLLRATPGIDELVAQGETLPPFDVHAPLLSLPHILGTTLETIPGGVPNVTAPAPRFRLEVPPGTRLKVGITWAGNPMQENDRNRSCPSRHFVDLMAGRPGVAFYSLQKGERAPDIAAAVADGRVQDLSDKLEDFGDTAAVIAQLDLVIGIESAVSHLAGAMGAPVWALLCFLPDWRYLLEREDCPWYPSMRLFRQARPGDWDGVFARVAAELDALTGGAPVGPVPGRPAPDRGDETAAATSATPPGGRIVQLDANASPPARPGDRADAPSEAVTLALAHRRAQRPAEAEAVCRARLATAPEDVKAANLLGIVLLDQGRIVDAVACFRGLLARAPENMDALNNLVIALKKQGRPDDAVAACRDAVARCPDLAAAHDCLGRALTAAGDMAGATAAYRRAVTLKPDLAMAHNGLGVSLYEQGRLDEAVDALRQAVAAAPNLAMAHSNLGNALRRRGYLEAAADRHRHAVALQPDYAIAHNNLGITLRDLGRGEEAIACFQRALGIDRDFAEAHYNAGAAFQALHRLPLAERHYRRALAIKPNLAEAHSNLGNTVKDLGRVAESVEHFERALALDPDHVEANWNRGLALLLLGDLRRGFEGYEWRWRLKDGRARQFRQPLWDGSDLAGRRILLHAEQGFGDTLQFVRYASVVAARGGRVIVECQPALERLLRSTPEINELVAQGAELPPFDVHAPLLSLPRILGTTLETIPGGVPYVTAPAPRFRLEAPPGTRLKVGIAWAGNPIQENDRNRSCPARHFLDLLAGRPGVAFYNLQMGERAAEIAAAVRDGRVLDPSDRIEDFADTAATIEQLDLVISVDSAVAHLAGAMAAPIWTTLCFLPDWRYLIEREDCPWYPTMRLFRQTRPGDWAGVLARVAAELDELAGGPAERGSAAPSATSGISRPRGRKRGRSPDRTALKSGKPAAATLDLAIAHRKSGRLDEAEAACRRVVAAAPGNVEAINLLGVVLMEKGRLEDAVACFRRALARDPRHVGALNNLGMTLKQLDRPDEAVDACRRAIAIEPNLAEAYNNLGRALRSRGNLEESADAYRKAIALRPGLIAAYNNLGGLLLEQDKRDEAAEWFRKAHAVNPASPAANFYLAIVKTFTAGDPQIGAMERLLANPNQTPADRNYLLFALGEAFDQLGQYDRAFRHYAEGNRLKRLTFDYDVREDVRSFGIIIDTLRSSVFAGKQDFGDPSALPIFALGMPRSGKTLVERVLTRHPDVAAEGESYVLTRLVQNLSRRLGPGAGFPSTVATLTARQARALGADYVSELRTRNPEAARIVNTRPGNFAYIGLIHLILPRARIINCVRDPLDTCLACYFQNFNAQPYATDLADLGQYYLQYRRIMDHWREILPGRILDVNYEDLVADPIRESRRIFEFCGLDWDAAFPGLGEGAAAARFPIALRSDEIGRWRHYERQLEPLRHILDSASPAARPGAG